MCNFVSKASRVLLWGVFFPLFFSGGGVNYSGARSDLIVMRAHTHTQTPLSWSSSSQQAVSKMKGGDRSNVMSAVSTQAWHVSAASLVITTSHRETRVFAFICRCSLIPPPPLGRSSWQRWSSTQERDVYAGRKRIIGVSGLCMCLCLSRTFTHKLSHSTLHVCTNTFQRRNAVFDSNEARQSCFYCLFN